MSADCWLLSVALQELHILTQTISMNSDDINVVSERLALDPVD